MKNSITYFQENIIQKLENIFVTYSSDMTKMAELRAYYYNGGAMLELVRYQKEELPKVAGNEDIIYSSSQMWREERKRRNELGQLAEIKVYSIPYTQIKKIANFKAQIFGL